MRKKVTDLTADIVPSLEKSKNRAEKKADKATDLMRKLDRDWREEKAVNEGLMERVEKLSSVSDELKKENDALKEQLRCGPFGNPATLMTKPRN